jgi:glycosyltransferase involved in cell wall biosynthesis
MQTGLVSVMMPAYNTARYIGQAIESVLAQTYPEWELLVVNDGSTDDTAEVAARFTDPRIRLINKTNGGESSARNVALDHSRGEFIAYLDADDAYLPHHLAATRDHLGFHPELEAVYTDGYHIDRYGQRLKTLQSRRRGPFEGRLFEEAVRASDVFGPPICVVARHAIIAKHHLRYDPRIVIGPDWDFFVRLADLAEFGYLNDRTCLYRVHQSNITAQVDSEKRARYLAICREKAIRMENFKCCSMEIRTAVFYDLLVNLLTGLPERQAAITLWPEFTSLPAVDQSRLLRLMASKSIANSGERAYVQNWLQSAQTLNPSDPRGTLVAKLHKVSPYLCRQVLRAKSGLAPNSVKASPFADMTFRD